MTGDQSCGPLSTEQRWRRGRPSRRVNTVHGGGGSVSMFVPGAELSRRFYDEVVQPVLSATFPGLPHAAALLGRGSEVLGFDDEMSTDHDWKPRVLVFLAEQDEPRRGAEVREALRGDLPPTFVGHPIHFEVHTVRGYVQQQLELDIDGDIEPRDW